MQQHDLVTLFGINMWEYYSVPTWWAVVSFRTRHRSASPRHMPGVCIQWSITVKSCWTCSTLCLWTDELCTSMSFSAHCTNRDLRFVQLMADMNSVNAWADDHKGCNMCAVDRGVDLAVASLCMQSGQICSLKVRSCRVHQQCRFGSGFRVNKYYEAGDISYSRLIK